jgi:hypothetical protein
MLETGRRGVAVVHWMTRGRCRGPGFARLVTHGGGERPSRQDRSPQERRRDLGERRPGTQSRVATRDLGAARERNRTTWASPGKKPREGLRVRRHKGLGLAGGLSWVELRVRVKNSRTQDWTAGICKFGFDRIWKRSNSEYNMEIWKPVEQTSNRLRSEFEFSTPNFEPNPNLSEKYGIDRVKSRKRCGSIRDISVLFSTLDATSATDNSVLTRTEKVWFSWQSALPYLEPSSFGGKKEIVVAHDHSEVLSACSSSR